MKKLRLCFMGTPDFAVPALAALADSGHDLVCVYTQPPRPAGRGNKLAKSAVHRYAESRGIAVRHPKSLKNAEAQAEFAALDLDLAIVAAYGLILPKAILDAPRHGCLNIHGSLLPRWRGAAPIQRAILAGDTETGIDIMQMDVGLDTGDILREETTPITGTTTAQSLHDTLADMGARMVTDVVNDIAKGSPPTLKPQNETGMTYAKMLSREDGRIDWTQSAEQVERQLRALTPWPGVWCMAGTERLKVHSATITDGSGAPGEILDKNMTVSCGSGALTLTSVQPQNRKAMAGRSFINGSKWGVGDRLD
ncbi:MAG: methionyl-tRNA formyltransferase [Pseudomonadota bacterium]